MKFKSKTALHQHIRDLVKSGYLIPSWEKTEIEKNGKPFTRMTRIFKVNFKAITKEGDEK